MKNLKDSVTLWVMIILVLVVVAGGTYWYLSQNSPQTRTSATTVGTQQIPIQQGQNTVITTQQVPAQTAIQTKPETLSASPISGMAPLKVTFTGYTNYRTGYSLQYGDGSESDVSSCGETGPCSKSLPIEINQTHTYSSPGTYTATLSSEGYPYRVTVTVDGPTTSSSNTTPAGWNTYNNSQFGYTVAYPSGVTYSVDNSGKSSTGSVYFSVNGSNEFTVGVPEPLNNPNVAACMTSPKTAQRESLTNVGNVSINGVSFYTFTDATNKVYEAEHNGDCYSFEENVGNAQTPNTQLAAELDAIVQSFQFTK
jgi:hypothetical protein